MNFNFTTEKTEWNNIKDLLNEYFSELGYQNDGFHNNMIIEGEAYIINADNETIGFFSVGNAWDEGKMFRGFYIIPSKRRYSIEIFNEIMEKYEIISALVASNDSHFISLAFEKMNALKTTFDMQAFNFIYGEAEREAEFGIECFSRVQPEDFDTMNKLTENQWDGMFENSKHQFYVLKKDNEILGYGSIAGFNYNNQNVDIGNFTLPQHRRKGVGRSIIINLSKIAIEQGFTPVAGCWYGNKQSLATLKSSGMIPENRIFYVRFK